MISMSVSSTSNTLASSSPCTASPPSDTDSELFDIKQLVQSCVDRKDVRRREEADGAETSVGNLELLMKRREKHTELARNPPAATTTNCSSDETTNQRPVHSTDSAPSVLLPDRPGPSAGRGLAKLSQRSPNLILKSRPLLISHCNHSPVVPATLSSQSKACDTKIVSATRIALSSSTTTNSGDRGDGTGKAQEEAPPPGAKRVALTSRLATRPEPTALRPNVARQRQTSARLVTSPFDDSGPFGAGQPSSPNAAAAAKQIDLGKKLLEAARQNQVELVRRLVVQAGAPFASDWLGTTALHLAAQNGSSEACDILLRAGVNRDARTKLERTALHLAAQRGSLEVVELLVSQGADVNARDMLKMTPLHWAAERGHPAVVRRLLAAGADRTLRSKFRLTPADVARRSDDSEVIELLVGRPDDSEAAAATAEAAAGDPDSADAEATRRLHLVGYQDDDQHPLAFQGNPSPDFQRELCLIERNFHQTTTTSLSTSTTARSVASDSTPPMLDFDELVEFDWSQFESGPDFVVANGQLDEQAAESHLAYFKRKVEELQRENRQLKQQVEQLSSSGFDADR